MVFQLCRLYLSPKVMSCAVVCRSGLGKTLSGASFSHKCRKEQANFPAGVFSASVYATSTKGRMCMNVSSGRSFGTTFLLVAGLALAGLGVASEARAERISNKVAEFSGLDKITGRITTFDVYINETVQFGALQVTPKVCYSRTENEAPRTDSFVQVDEITLDRKIRRIFSGWMFADSPGLNAVDHPVYDIWLKDCKQTSDIPAPQ